MRLYHPGFGCKCKPAAASWSVSECGEPAVVPVGPRRRSHSVKQMYQYFMNNRLQSVLAAALLLAAQSIGAALPASVDGQPLPSLAPILEEVMPAVVNVHTRTRVQVRTSPFFDDPFFR